MPSESNRSASVRRHYLLIDDLLRGKEHDRHSLAERLGVKPAQADRLIKAALKVHGVTERRDGKQRKIGIDPAAIVPPPSYPTAVAACFGSSLWPLFQGTGYKDGIREAARHVVGRTARRSVFRDIDRKFWFLPRGGEAALDDRAPLLDEVIDAVLRTRVLSIEYTRFAGKSEHLRIEPLSIAVHDHQLYVIGRTEGGVLHPYRFARIASVEVLDDTFAYPPQKEYDPAAVFRDSFGVFLDGRVQEVEVLLHKKWAVYAQSHRWHDSQHVEPAGDRVRVRLRVRTCPELEAWILGFGEEAEVVAPAALRSRIAERASALAGVYAGRGPSVRKAGRMMSMQRTRAH